MRAFRVADRRFPIYDGTGARLVGGRWNSPGRPLIYAAETFAGALLEVLIHSNLGRIPKTHAVVEISIPDTLAMETVISQDILAWDGDDQIAGRIFGDRWLAEQRSAVLLVPSVITGDREHNVLINPQHPDFSLVTASQPQSVRGDKRLFQ